MKTNFEEYSYFGGAFAGMFAICIASFFQQFSAIEYLILAFFFGDALLLLIISHILVRNTNN